MQRRARGALAGEHFVDRAAQLAPARAPTRRSIPSPGRVAADRLDDPREVGGGVDGGLGEQLRFTAVGRDAQVTRPPVEVLEHLAALSPTPVQVMSTDVVRRTEFGRIRGT